MANNILSGGSAHYSIWLKNPAGQRIKSIDRFTSLKYTLAVNGIGVLKLKLPPSFSLDLIQEDSQIEVYRQLPGGTKYRDGDAVWFIRDWEWAINRVGNESITLLAYSASELLNRAIVAYASGTSYSTKSSMAIDDMIKALVRENLGSLATDTARDKSTYLIVEDDQGLGPTTTKSMAWRQLLPTLRELAEDSENAGTPMYFDVIRRTGESVFSTVTYINWRDSNHGADSGNRVILSVRNGTLSELKWNYQTFNERNYIYVGGQNIGSSRTITEVQNSDRQTISQFGRRELFVDASSTADAGLNAEGEAALRKYQVRETFLANIRDTRAIRFGREYNYGSVIVADLGRRIVDARIDAIEITKERGRETIKGQLRV